MIAAALEILFLIILFASTGSTTARKQLSQSQGRFQRYTGNVEPINRLEGGEKTDGLGWQAWSKRPLTIQCGALALAMSQLMVFAKKDYGSKSGSVTSDITRSGTRNIAKENVARSAGSRKKRNRVVASVLMSAIAASAMMLLRYSSLASDLDASENSTPHHLASLLPSAGDVEHHSLTQQVSTPNEGLQFEEGKVVSGVLGGAEKLHLNKEYLTGLLSDEGFGGGGAFGMGEGGGGNRGGGGIHVGAEEGYR
ncbi:hypothetical protein AAMO2058_001025800 [Amorphochlora amoebiformis]